MTPIRLCCRAALLAAISLFAASALAQGNAPAAGRPAAGAAAHPAASADHPANGMISPAGPFRKLAPGVLQNVDSKPLAADAIERHDVTELLYLDPNFDFAKDIPFRHKIWMLDIKYKPVRMVWADIPSPGGRMVRKQIWYIVYQVTNTGNMFQVVESDDELNKLNVSGKLYKLVSDNAPVRFAPVFTLETHALLANEQPGFSKAKIEECIPIAIPAIRNREDHNRELLSSTEMAQHELHVGESAWGVATWQDIDPNNVWFSVYVEGLTNAYKWTDNPSNYAAFRKYAEKPEGTPPTPYREISTKVLKLNFWRPGDEFSVREVEVRPGVPELPNGPKARPASEWVWWRTYPVARNPVPAGG